MSRIHAQQDEFREGQPDEVVNYGRISKEMGKFSGHKNIRDPHVKKSPLSYEKDVYCANCNTHHLITVVEHGAEKSWKSRDTDAKCPNCGDAITKQGHPVQLYESKSGAADWQNSSVSKASEQVYNPAFNTIEIHHPDGKVESAPVGGKFMDVDAFFNLNPDYSNQGKNDER